jgi:hypothetical protein
MIYLFIGVQCPEEKKRVYDGYLPASNGNNDYPFTAGMLRQTQQIF